MDTKEILRRIYAGADLYKELLLDRQFLYVYEVCNGRYEYIEVVFKKDNYQHLTGIKIEGVGGADFFERCVHRRISERQMVFDKNGIAELKLTVLESAIRGISKAQMVGISDNARIFLRSDKFVGGIQWCVGFVRGRSTGAMFPNTLLKEDIRSVSKKRVFRILLVLQKKRFEQKYSVVVKTAKGIDGALLVRALKLEEKVDCAGISC